MSLLNRTETKYIQQKLKEVIINNQRIIKQCTENLNNPQLPNYDESAYNKNVNRLNKEIVMCEKILSKL